MATSERGADPRPSPGLLHLLTAYLGTWVDLLRIRLELLSTELQEEKHRLQQVMILAVASAVCLAFGLLLVTLFVVVAFWETDYRMLVLGAFAVLYLAAGVTVAVITAKKSRAKPKLLSATIGELAKDYNHLTS